LNGENKKKVKNSFERKRNRHQATISTFSLNGDTSLVGESGYVEMGQRKPTNCFCFLIFVVYLLAMIGMSMYGFIKGDYRKLIAS